MTTVLALLALVGLAATAVFVPWLWAAHAERRRLAACRANETSATFDRAGHDRASPDEQVTTVIPDTGSGADLDENPAATAIRISVDDANILGAALTQRAPAGHGAVA